MTEITIPVSLYTELIRAQVKANMFRDFLKTKKGKSIYSDEVEFLREIFGIEEDEE